MWWGRAGLWTRSRSDATDAKLLLHSSNLYSMTKSEWPRMWNTIGNSPKLKIRKNIVVSSTPHLRILNNISPNFFLTTHSKQNNQWSEKSALYRCVFQLSYPSTKVLFARRMQCSQRTLDTGRGMRTCLETSLSRLLNCSNS